MATARPPPRWRDVEAVWSWNHPRYVGQNRRHATDDRPGAGRFKSRSAVHGFSGCRLQLSRKSPPRAQRAAGAMRDRLISAKHTTRYALKNGFHHEIAIKFHHERAPTSFLPRATRGRLSMKLVKTF